MFAHFTVTMSQCKQPGIFPISIHLCYLGCLCVITGRHSKIVVCKDGGEAYTQRGATRVPGELGVIQDQCFWLGKLNRTKVNPPHSGCSLCLGLSQNSRNRWGCWCQLCKLSSNFKWTVWAERKSRSLSDSSFRARAQCPEPPTFSPVLRAVGSAPGEGSIDNPPSPPIPALVPLLLLLSLPVTLHSMRQR